MTKHIHHLASIITEDPCDYDGLEDADKFVEPTANGYGCGRNCWEYEEFPFNIDGQILLGSATINYDGGVTVHGRYRRATMTSPEEWPDVEAIIEEAKVTTFEVDSNNGDLLIKWHNRAGRKYERSGMVEWAAGFVVGHLSDEQLQNVLDQVLQQFAADEEQVEEYMMDEHNYDDCWYNRRG